MKIFTKTQHMTAAALIMGASILLSRIMGLVRDTVISRQFGTGGEADMYFAAFVVPDFINYLLAGGYVSITLIPLLARRMEEDAEDARLFFSTVYSWSWIAVLLAGGLAWVFAPRLAPLAAPGFDAAQIERLSFFLRIILPAQIFFLPGTCLSALLYLRRQFFVPALTPLVYNGCIISGGLLLPLVLPVQGMEGFCWGVVAGAAVGAFLLPFLVARRGGLHVRFHLRHPLMRRFLAVALPLMLGQSVVMLNEQFVRVFGSLAEKGAVSLLSYAGRISQVPVGIVAQAAGAAAYPFLAKLLAEENMSGFYAALRSALRGSLLVIIPLAAWMIVAAVPTLGFIFQGGRFGPEHTAAAVPLLQIMLLAVPFWAVQQIVGRAFYARGDTLTPALSGTFVTVLALPFFFWAARAFGAEGVAWVSFAGVLAYAMLLMLLWRRVQGDEAFSGIGPDIVRCGILCLPAAFLARQSLILGNVFTLPSVFADFAALAISAGVFAASWLLLLRLFAPHLLEMLRHIRRRTEK